MARRRPSLARALAYRNEQIVHKFTDAWDVTVPESRELFTETKRLLWLLDHSQAQGTPFALDPALTILDQMWHNFVLFTEEYTAYCTRVFGRFIHHRPATHEQRRRERAAWRRDPAGALRRQHAAEAARWRLVNDTLGEATLLKWYVELPLRYPDRFFRRGPIPLAPGWKPPAALARLVRRR